MDIKRHIKVTCFSGQFSTRIVRKGRSKLATKLCCNTAHLEYASRDKCLRTSGNVAIHNTVEIGCFQKLPSSTTHGSIIQIRRSGIKNAKRWKARRSAAYAKSYRRKKIFRDPNGSTILNGTSSASSVKMHTTLHNAA